MSLKGEEERKKNNKFRAKFSSSREIEFIRLFVLKPLLGVKKIKKKILVSEREIMAPKRQLIVVFS